MAQDIKKNIMDALAEGKNVSYPVYNICCKHKDGKEEVITERATLSQGISAIKTFDKMVTCQAKVVKDILYLFLLPLEDVIITE